MGSRAVPQHHILMPKPQHHIPCPYLSIASDSLTIWAMSPLWIFCCTSSSWALVHLYLTWEKRSDRAPKQRTSAVRNNN